MLTELKLQIVRKNGRSIIGDSYFTSPLKLGTPDAERDRLNVVFMMASAGILKGDEFVYNIRCGERNEDADDRRSVLTRRYLIPVRKERRSPSIFGWNGEPLCITIPVR